MQSYLIIQDIAPLYFKMPAWKKYILEIILINFHHLWLLYNWELNRKIY